MEQVYLRSNIQVEPLIDRWYAWAHLIPPTTSARNLTERHLRIMQSYVSAPQVHANAVKNPKMRGGPFIDYGGKRVDEIQSLIEQTLTKRANLVALSKALEELDRMLQTSCKGESLREVYSRVPDLLKGYVELIYDLNCNPSYRVLEPLLYRSDLYNPDGQSLTLSEINGDDRPFILSTPRLSGPGLLNLKLPFHDESIDELFAAKRDAKPFSNLLERCGVAQADEQLFRAFFASEPSRKYSSYKGDGVRWRYFGHACILLETRTLSILFDPILSYTYESGLSRYTYDDLPDKIDFVLITHNHQDHILLETLLQLRHKIGTILVPRGGGPLQDPNLKLTLEKIGFASVVELGEMETLKLDCGSLRGLPFFGEHADLDIRTKLAYLIELKGHKLLFAADSCNVEPALYRHLHKEIGDIRALFVGMECDGAPLSWLYGPLLSQRIDRAFDESRRLSGSNFAQAVEIVRALKCSEVFVYAMGQEPWLSHITSLKYTPESNPIVQSTQLLEHCQREGLVAERLFGEREMLLN